MNAFLIDRTIALQLCGTPNGIPAHHQHETSDRSELLDRNYFFFEFMRHWAAILCDTSRGLEFRRRHAAFCSVRMSDLPLFALESAYEYRTKITISRMLAEHKVAPGLHQASHKIAARSLRN